MCFWHVAKRGPDKRSEGKLFVRGGLERMSTGEVARRDRERRYSEDVVRGGLGRSWSEVEKEAVLGGFKEGPERRREREAPEKKLTREGREKRS